VPAHEAFTYDLRGEAQVSGAFRALDVGVVAVQEFVVGRDDFGRVGGDGDGCGSGTSEEGV
jgi:hypothetical protein